MTKVYPINLGALKRHRLLKYIAGAGLSCVILATANQTVVGPWRALGEFSHQEKLLVELIIGLFLLLWVLSLAAIVVALLRSRRELRDISTGLVLTEDSISIGGQTIARSTIQSMQRERRRLRISYIEGGRPRFLSIPIKWLPDGAAAELATLVCPPNLDVPSRR